MTTDAKRATYRDGFRAGWDDGKLYLFAEMSAIMRAGESPADDENPEARKLLEAVIRWAEDGRPNQERSLRLFDQRLRLQYADHDVIDATEHVDRRLRELEQGEDDPC